MRRFVIVCAALAALTSAPSRAAAQAGLPLRPIGGGPSTGIVARPDPTLVTVMLVPSLDPPEAHAVVIRRAHGTPANLILVTPRTTPADLSHAVSALMLSRQHHGEQVARDMRAVIAPATTHARGTVNARRAAEDLRTLATGPTTRVPGVGAGRAIQVRMMNRAPAAR